MLYQPQSVAPVGAKMAVIKLEDLSHLLASFSVSLLARLAMKSLQFSPSLSLALISAMSSWSSLVLTREGHAKNEPGRITRAWNFITMECPYRMSTCFDHLTLHLLTWSSFSMTPSFPFALVVGVPLV